MLDVTLTFARRSWFPSLLLAFSLTVACGPAPDTTPSPEPNPANSDTFFRQEAEKWDRLFSAADLDGLIALYSPDLISMPFNTPTVEGQEAQRAGFEQFFAANPGARHETFVDQIIATDNWAVERSRYRMSYTPKTTGKEVVETGRHVMYRERVGGAWLISWEIWNTDQPLP